MKKTYQILLLILSVCFATVSANAQSFRVQCPTSTVTHPDPTNAGINNSESAYTGPTSPTNVNGAIKCQQISGGDGYATMGDGTQTYMFSFGPLSGLADIANGLPGTESPSTFNVTAPAPLQPGDPATTDGIVTNTWPSSFTLFPLSTSPFTYNGAVGLSDHVANLVSIYDISESWNNVRVVGNAPLGVAVGDQVTISGTDTTGYNGTFTVSSINVANPFFPASYAFTYTNPTTGLAEVTASTTATAALPPRIDGHVDPRPIMDVGVMNGNIPAPLMAFDEDDEFFLTLTNVGMIMRPDLFEQHTVHFHGYPNASAFYDGVPDASVAINIGASFTYYYLAPDAGTYFWHCHVTPPEHLQKGMVGQLYVRPRQNRLPVGTDTYLALTGSAGTGTIGTAGGPGQQSDLRTACYSSGASNLRFGFTGTPTADILCSTPAPAADSGFTHAAGYQYVYNDGDGSTRYDIDVPLQIHGFDPNFHFVGMTFNPEGFSDMKDKYFLLNGRSYPDTVGVAGGPADVLGQLAGATNPDPGTHAISTNDTDSISRASQPLPTLITLSASGGPVSATCPAAPCGQRAALRIADLDVQEYQTLSSIGIPMQLVGFNAKLLRDQAGNNMYVTTNSITLGGGESLDVILDSTGVPPGTYFLYTPQLDHLSNDAENFGGLMTEVVVTP